MFAAALIVFREVLEASLVISIIMAATQGVARRSAWISFGIAGGLVGAGLVAAFTNFLSTLFQGSGQDVVNAGILSLAVLLIGWHVVWMNVHGRQMAAEMRETGRSVAEGKRDLSILAIVVGIAVMREGSEIVLMLQGLWTTGSTQVMLGGAAFGLAGGMLAGALMYFGFVALPVARMFTLTNGFLVLIAAGMAARAANFLAQAGLVSSLGGRMWDTSGILSDQSLVGQVFAALIGYIARPSGIEVLCYAVTLTTILILMQMAHRKNIKAVRAVAIGLLFLTAPLMHAKPAHAEEVLSPYVTQGEWEIEQQGFVSHDSNPDNSNEKSLMTELGYSPTSWYKVELEGEIGRNPGDDQTLRHTSFNVENTFQLAEPGEYWIDPGFFYEMDFPQSEDPNNIIFGFLGAKTIGHVAETFNLLLHKDYGPNNTPMGFIYSNQAKYRLKPWLEPGFELYGDTDGKDRFDDQQLAIGPGLFGKIYTFNGQALKYEFAYLFGATTASPDGAVRWKIEYEVSF
jgi:high-affinity iron transporter